MALLVASFVALSVVISVVFSVVSSLEFADAVPTLVSSEFAGVDSSGRSQVIASMIMAMEMQTSAMLKTQKSPSF